MVRLLVLGVPILLAGALCIWAVLVARKMRENARLVAQVSVTQQPVAPAAPAKEPEQAPAGPEPEDDEPDENVVTAFTTLGQ